MPISSNSSSIGAGENGSLSNASITNNSMTKSPAFGIVKDIFTSGGSAAGGSGGSGTDSNAVDSGGVQGGGQWAGGDYSSGYGLDDMTRNYNQRLNGNYGISGQSQYGIKG